MKHDSKYDAEWIDTRRAPGGKSRLQGRLNDGFLALFYGDQDPADLSVEERRDLHLPPEDDY